MQKRSKLWISLFVSAVLILHVVPMLQRLQGERQTWWPIMAWGMYKESHEPGPITLNQRRIIGINAKGEEQEIYHWQSGYSPLAFKKMFIKPMSNGDAEAARRLAKKINRRLDVPIISFRVESQVYTLTDAGVTREDSPPIIFDSLN